MTVRLGNDRDDDQGNDREPAKVKPQPIIGYRKYHAFKN